MNTTIEHNQQVDNYFRIRKTNSSGLKTKSELFHNKITCSSQCFVRDYGQQGEEQFIFL